MNKAEKFELAQAIQFSEGSVVSKTILKQKGGNITLFSFDEGQGLSEHATPFDALVTILDGQAQITIGGENHILNAGESIIMPASVPHALHAAKALKMMLTMVKDMP